MASNNKVVDPAKRNRRNNRIIKTIWWSVAGFFALMLVVFILIYNGVIGYMPPIEAADRLPLKKTIPSPPPKRRSP